MNSRSHPVGVGFRPLLTLLVEMIGKDYNELPSRDSTRCSTLASQAAEIAELKRQLSAAHAAGSAHGAALMAKAVIDDSDLGPASALLSSPEQVCSTITAPSVSTGLRPSATEGHWHFAASRAFFTASAIMLPNLKPAMLGACSDCGPRAGATQDQAVQTLPDIPALAESPLPAWYRARVRESTTKSRCGLIL